MYIPDFSINTGYYNLPVDSDAGRDTDYRAGIILEALTNICTDGAITEPHFRNTETKKQAFSAVAPLLLEKLQASVGDESLGCLVDLPDGECLRLYEHTGNNTLEIIYYDKAGGKTTCIIADKKFTDLLKALQYSPGIAQNAGTELYPFDLLSEIFVRINSFIVMGVITQQLMDCYQPQSIKKTCMKNCLTE